MAFFSLPYVDLFIFQDFRTLESLEFSLPFPTLVPRPLGASSVLLSSENTRTLQVER